MGSALVMTKDTMREVARICATADAGCAHCAWDLFSRLDEKWPGHRGVLAEVWRDEFGGDLDLDREP